MTLYFTNVTSSVEFKFKIGTKIENFHKKGNSHPPFQKNNKDLNLNLLYNFNKIVNKASLFEF